MWGEGKVRSSKSGCLGRCESGPVCVIYPDGVWYTDIDENDVREIVDKHLLGGMTAGFNYYRALKEDAALVETFKGKKLSMPVLTIGGRYSVGDKLQKSLSSETTSLKSVIIEDSGHFVPEENPEVFNSTVMEFIGSHSRLLNLGSLLQQITKNSLLAYLRESLTCRFFKNNGMAPS